MIDEKGPILKIQPRIHPYPRRVIQTIGPIGVVPLTQERFALIDAEDAARVGERYWSFRLKQGQPIAHSNVRLECGRSVPVPLHRFVLNAATGALVDHINGDTLDNRKCNLRLADRAGNAFNSRRRRDNTSGFKGVTFDRRREKWVARIKAGDARLTMGPFETPEEAHAAYVEAALRLHGEFARVA